MPTETEGCCLLPGKAEQRGGLASGHMRRKSGMHVSMRV